MPRQIVDQAGEVISQEIDDDDYLYENDADDDLACATCRGSGTVNPLTAPAGFFCAVTSTCPDCEGSGRL